MTKYLFSLRKNNNLEVISLKALVLTILWTIIFLIFGVYVNYKIFNFTEKYDEKIKIIEEYIEINNLEKAREEIELFSKSWHKEKGIWYKLLNHEYFDSICLYLNILEKSILVDDKSNAFQQIENIKTTLDNILESEKCDLNHIF